MTVSELARRIKSAVKWLSKQDEGCVTIKLDDRLAVCVGWQDGFIPDDNRCIHSRNDEDWCIVSGIKVWTSDDVRTDYQFINYPYYKDGDVYDVDISIKPNQNYNQLAKWFMKCYRELQDYYISENGQISEQQPQDQDNWDY